MFTKYYNLQLFAEETQTTLLPGLSAEMKTFYSDYLIDNAVPKLVHDQFGQKHPIPKNGGKSIEFRKYDPLGKAMTPLTEGVTPKGNKLSVKTIKADVLQYGDYIELSDMLILTAIDNNMMQATKLLGAQAGATMDTITRNELCAGTNVICSGGVSSEEALSGGAGDDTDCYLTVDDIMKAARFLKAQNAEKIGDSYVAIIHPDIAYDLMHDPMWRDVKTYCDPKDMYEGEIGKIAGVRFVETTEAKIEAGKGIDGRAVYTTLVLGENAYGTTEIEGGGLKHIVKQLGSAGTADALDQRATVGWKATKVAKRLVEQFMVCIKSCSTFNPEEDN